MINIKTLGLKIFGLFNTSGNQINPATEEGLTAITDVLTDGGTAVKFSDSPNLDAFQRLRVSEVTTLIDIKQLHDSQPLLIDEVTNGTGSAAHVPADAQTTMSTLVSGDYVIRQTYQRANYQSGKSHFILMTFSDFSADTNVNKKVGYFTSSTAAPYTADLDGIFLENDGTDVYLKVYKTGILKHSVRQDSWNDPLDGTGESGVVINWGLTNIFALDFQWLGAGRIRAYVEIAGQLIKFHELLNANVGGTVYMSSPNQPLRWEIRQSGAGAGRFNQICSSVNSEGATNLIGKVLSDNAGTNDLQFNASGTNYAGIGIRLKSTHLDQVIDILNFDYMAETNDRALWELRLNPTVTGTFNYTDITDAAVQTSVGNQTGGSAPTVTGGTVLASGYVQQQGTVNIQLDSAIRLGGAIDGTPDEIILCVTPIQAGLDAFVSYTWREL
jgi:hypothetical protein